MKKVVFIAMATALVLGLAQCKKEQPQPQDPAQGEKVFITLDVSGSNGSSNGAKVEVDPAYGTVEFEDGDQILVGYNKRYVGTLTYETHGEQKGFTGEITINQNGDQPLYFYFFGNKYTGTLTAGTTTSCRVSIADQTNNINGKLPVISWAPSNENYPSTDNHYSAKLLNKCALVKFNVTTSSSAPTCITGFNNMVFLSFSNNNMAPSNHGDIRLPAGSGERWAILLPKADAVEGEFAFSEDGLYYGTVGTVPAIGENDYIPDGIEVNLNQMRHLDENYPGAMDGLFTVNSSGKQVRFSMGNLQYIGSAGNGDDNNTGAYWQFAATQWKILGITTGQNSDSKIVDRDLFGWGTSGWNNGNTYYQPWCTADYEESNNGQLYGPPGEYDLTGPYANADWGVYNPISNGGNAVNQWRTLTSDEWVWLLGPKNNPDPGNNCRSGFRYAKATVNGQAGLIVLPDGWNEGTYALTETNNGSASYTVNQISGEDWMRDLEPNGAVFLPAASYREKGTAVTTAVGYGRYWSSSCHNSSSATFVSFYDSFNPQNSISRYFGYSVRLVKDVN